MMIAMKDLGKCYETLPRALPMDPWTSIIRQNFVTDMGFESAR